MPAVLVELATYCWAPTLDGQAMAGRAVLLNSAKATVACSAELGAAAMSLRPAATLASVDCN